MISFPIFQVYSLVLLVLHGIIWNNHHKISPKSPNPKLAPFFPWKPWASGQRQGPESWSCPRVFWARQASRSRGVVFFDQPLINQMYYGYRFRLYTGVFTISIYIYMILYNLVDYTLSQFFIQHNYGKYWSITIC